MRRQRHISQPPQLPAEFITYAAGVLAPTKSLKTWETEFTELAVDRDVSLTIKDATGFTKKPYVTDCLNDFDGTDQYSVILKATTQVHLLGKEEFQKVKRLLVSKFGAEFATDESLSIIEPLVEDTKHWLESYPDALERYTNAEKSYREGGDTRNMMDDLRLSLELLLKTLLESDRTLENLLKELKEYMKKHGATSQLTHMLNELIKYYAAYQNENVKHHNRADRIEAELIFDLTSSFIRHLVRISQA